MPVGQRTNERGDFVRALCALRSSGLWAQGVHSLTVIGVLYAIGASGPHH
ncbi:hypothetical protein ACIBK8_28665 [Streptomyces sp. NPDC050161]